MAANASQDRKHSSILLLQELEALSQSLNAPPSIPSTKRRTNSLVLIPTEKNDHADHDLHGININPKPRSRRMSLSLWSSRTNHETPIVNKNQFTKNESKPDSLGLWKWKPIRVLSHIGKKKLSCLLSVEVVSVHGLPASMNGLRVSVSVRKKETKDGAVQTMPSRVFEGGAEFEERLFIRCHVYCMGWNSQPKFEPRPFVIRVFAVDAKELDFGRHGVDLSQLIQESVEKNLQGSRVRQWDACFNLSGKAKGGELNVKLGFQIMETEGKAGIYNQADEHKLGQSKRRQSKSMLGVPSARIFSRPEAYTPSLRGASVNFQGIDELNLDKLKTEDVEPLDFEVLDKGIEVEDRDETDGTRSEDNSDKRSVTSEALKELMHDRVHLTRLMELDSIAQQIKALVSMMEEEGNMLIDEETESQRLDEDENKVTREFLRMLQHKDGKQPCMKHDENDSEETESKVFLPDLGKGLGCVVQTRNEGYLAAMNPLGNLTGSTPKLAMQISRPMVIPSNESLTGIEMLQKLAAISFEELSSKILSLMPVEELVGKTAEQIAFEGIASAIISGRKKRGVSTSAAHAITVAKSMAAGMSTGRKERILSGIWDMNEKPLSGDEILALSLQKIEDMAIEALKVQADMAEEDAPSDISPSLTPNHPLANAVTLEDWMENKSVADAASCNEGETITLSIVIQMRDPLRQYEAVGGPLIALIHATAVEIELGMEKRFKVESLSVGGLKLRSGGKKNEWDTEKQRLTAMQWLVGYGLGKAKKKGKRVLVKGPNILWSISSHVMVDRWLKSIRNPDVKFTK